MICPRAPLRTGGRGARAAASGLRKELETELAADKKALAEATALRNKQLAEFQGMETDSIQALENLKAAECDVT